MTELQGRMLSVSRAYRGGWGFGTMLTESGPIRVVGTLNNPPVGSSVIVHGEWGSHPTYGSQFEVEELVFDLPKDAPDVIRWLCTVDGIGAARAKALVESYPGDKLWQVLHDTPDQLCLLGIPMDAVTALRLAAIDLRAVRSIYITGFGLGLTSKEISRLNRKLFQPTLREVALDKIETAVTGLWNVVTSTPWDVLYFGLRLGFGRTDTVAREWGHAQDSLDRLAAALVEAVRSCADDGDTIVAVTDAISLADRVIHDHSHGSVIVSKDQWFDAGSVAIDKEALVMDDHGLVLASLYRAEGFISNGVSRLLKADAQRDLYGTDPIPGTESSS